MRHVLRAVHMLLRDMFCLIFQLFGKLSGAQFCKFTQSYAVVHAVCLVTACHAGLNEWANRRRFRACSINSSKESFDPPTQPVKACLRRDTRASRVKGCPAKACMCPRQKQQPLDPPPSDSAKQARNVIWRASVLSCDMYL